MHLPGHHARTDTRDTPDTGETIVPVSDGGGAPTHATHHHIDDVSMCRVSRAAYVAGFDPGLTGAFAILSPGGELLAVDDLPVMGTGKAARIDATSLARLIADFAPAKAVVEQVGSMPGQGVASTFAFGRAVGTLAGVLGALSIPVEYVTPGAWKRRCGLSAEKEDARRRAIELWPTHATLFARKKDHGRAEAALIARWGTDRK